MAGCTTKGFIGCPVCAGGLRSRRSKVLHKNVFCNCARRFLRERHPMRFDVQSFGSVELSTAPEPATGAQILSWRRERERWVSEEGRPSQNDPVRRHGIKRVSGLYRLSYWQVRIHFVVIHMSSFFSYMYMLLFRCLCIHSYYIFGDRHLPILWRECKHYSSGCFCVFSKVSRFV